MSDTAANDISVHGYDPKRQARDTSWAFDADMSEVCTCGHPRSEHAHPGAAGTPCARPYCSCPTFGVIRNAT